MYLTRVVVDKKVAIKKGFVDPYAWHRALWKPFNPDTQKRDMLMRVDLKDTAYQVFVLSRHRPLVPDWGLWQTKQVSPGFLEHRTYRFDLRANPTIKKAMFEETGDKKKNGRRVGIVGSEALYKWLERKAEQSGFEVVNLDILPRPFETFYKKGQRGKHARVDFRGILRVLDRTAFNRAFEKGIGSAKAFGFGMLLLEPVH